MFQNYSVIFLKAEGENKLVKSVKVLPADIKSMNPMHKYRHIIELLACTLKMSALMFLFPTNYLISSGTSSTPKISEKTI